MISITCSSISFSLVCYRCQKLIHALPTYLYYLLKIPAYPSQFTESFNQTISYYEDSNIVIDITFYDRYDNVLEIEQN